MSNGHRSLRLAVRPAVVGGHLGRIYIAVAALLGPPIAVAATVGDLRLSGLTTAVALTMGTTGWLLDRARVGDDIQPNEAMTVTALVFVTVPVWITPIFVAAGLPPGPALFESIAAVTTAGLSMFSSVADLPPAFLFARAWMQWFGGLGFVALCAALVTGPGVAARRMAMEFDRDPGHVSSTYARARHVLGVYVVLTAAGYLALWATSGDPFLALVHALAAVATGGYSSFDEGPAGFGDGPQYVIVILCVLGALSFDLHGRLHRRQWRALLGDPGLRALGCAIALVALAVFLIEQTHRPADPWGALNLAVMAQTTAGFASRPLEALHPGSQAVLAASMLAGGDIGSTAGGIKLLRLVVLLRVVVLLLERSGLPRHVVVTARVDGRRIAESEMVALLGFLALLIAVIGLSWLAFLASGQPPFASLIEVIAAISTGGLSTGLTSLDLPGHLSWVLAFDMLAGRLEVVALLVLCYPGTWIGRRQSGR